MLDLKLTEFTAQSVISLGTVAGVLLYALAAVEALLRADPCNQHFDLADDLKGDAPEELPLRAEEKC